MNSYYVYALYDEKGIPFYIGKGKGYRINNHVKSSNLKHHSYKNHKILKLISEFGGVARSILSYHDSESSAFDTEEYLISFYGIASEGGVLVNVCKNRFDIPSQTRITLAKTERTRKCSDCEIIKYHALYLSGRCTIDEISRSLGHSSSYISAIFRGRKMKHLNLQSGKDFNIKKFKKPEIEKVLMLRASGLSYSEIVKITGISKTTVARYCKQNKGSGNGTGDSVAGQDNSVSNVENS